MTDTFVTLLNFKCNSCSCTIGQFIHKKEEKEEKIKCPNCKSDDCAYNTYLQ